MAFFVSRNEYSDRLLAQLNRRTGGQIAQMLIESTDNEKALEKIVGDALDYIGFNVIPIGGNGQPEGIAQAPLSPNADSDEGPFTFTYDAKSTSKENGRVTNKDVGPGRLARHRRDHDANYALVVAPDFQSGVLQDECRESQVTPMRAADLANLLILSARAGTLNFVEFRDLFELHDPHEVHNWVGKFVSDVESEPRVPIGDLLWAFDEIGISGPDGAGDDCYCRSVKVEICQYDLPVREACQRRRRRPKRVSACDCSK